MRRRRRGRSAGGRPLHRDTVLQYDDRQVGDHAVAVCQGKPGPLGDDGVRILRLDGEDEGVPAAQLRFCGIRDNVDADVGVAVAFSHDQRAIAESRELFAAGDEHRWQARCGELCGEVGADRAGADHYVSRHVPVRTG